MDTQAWRQASLFAVGRRPSTVSWRRRRRNSSELSIQLVFIYAGSSKESRAGSRSHLIE